MVGWHNRKLEERCRPPVKYLNVYGVDFLQLLGQNGVVVRVQDLRKGEDKVTAQRTGDIRWLECRKRAPKLVYAWLFCGVRESDDDLHGLRSLFDARFPQGSGL